MALRRGMEGHPARLTSAAFPSHLLRRSPASAEPRTEAISSRRARYSLVDGDQPSLSGPITLIRKVGYCFRQASHPEGPTEVPRFRRAHRMVFRSSRGERRGRGGSATGRRRRSARRRAWRRAPSPRIRRPARTRDGRVDALRLFWSTNPQVTPLRLEMDRAAVKPPAQPTLGRTQHLPPPARERCPRSSEPLSVRRQGLSPCPARSGRYRPSPAARGTSAERFGGEAIRQPARARHRPSSQGGTRSGIRSRQASPEAEPSAGTITVVIRRVVPGVQAWRACSMLIAAEIQRSLTGNRQAWSSAERELMPH